jgi:spermidine/putrescine transport system permease protein
MIGNVIQAKYVGGLPDYPSASAMSFILMAIIMAMVLGYARAVGAEKLTG